MKSEERAEQQSGYVPNTALRPGEREEPRECCEPGCAEWTDGNAYVCPAHREASRLRAEAMAPEVARLAALRAGHEAAGAARRAEAEAARDAAQERLIESLAVASKPHAVSRGRG